MRLQPVISGTLLVLFLVLVWVLSTGPLGFFSASRAALLLTPGLLFSLALAYMRGLSPTGREARTHLQFAYQQALRQKIRGLKELLCKIAR